MRIEQSRSKRDRAAHLTRRAFAAGLAGASLCGSPRARGADNSLCVVGTDGWLFSVWDDTRFSNLSEVQRISGDIAASAAQLQTAGIAVLILLIPSKSRVYQDFLPKTAKLSPDAQRRYQIALAKLAAGRTIVPDLATVLGALHRTQPQTDLFFRADTHWLPTAATPAAVECAHRIGQSLHLPPSPKPGALLGPPVTIVQQRNDLAALLPATQQASYKFQQYQVQSAVSASAEAALTDDDWADVVVIGNSFMQPAYGFAPMLSNQLGRPVALDWRVHQFSPYWLMLDYLGGAAFKRQRPKLMVWNFEETDMEVDSGVSGAWGPNAIAPAHFRTELQRLLAA